jgi:Lon-like protease
VRYWNWKRLGILAAIFAAVYAVSGLWLPLYSEGPGPAREVEPLIHVTGRTEYASQGKLIMTSVFFQQLTALGTLLAWLDPNRSVISRSDLYAPGETRQQEHARAISEMDQSKLDAAYVALTALGEYPKDHGTGALVEGVVPGCAADGELYPGDLIVAIDGTNVPGRVAASKAISAAPSGATLAFDVRVDGKPQTVDLVREPCGGKKDPLVGVSLIPNFPFGIRISSGDIGGPSAGLMWALGLYDLLTPGDLTAGRTIAGTGQIGLDGKVYPIGGIGAKLVAASRAGATVFLVPQGNWTEVQAAGSHGMKLLEVSTFQGALGALRQLQ